VPDPQPRAARRRLNPPPNSRRDGSGVQPGTAPGRRWRLSQLRAPKNDCERTRKQWTAIPTALLADQTHTTNDTRTQAHPRWRPGGSAPQTPRDLSPLCQARRENRNGTHSASRLRSRPLSRRSGRVSASPCPPLRYSAFYLRSNRRTTRGARRRAKTPPVPGRSCTTASSSAEPNPLPWGTCQESNRWLCVRSTRSSAVVFFKRASYFRSNPISGRIKRHTVSDPQRRQP
jgi:hypothetical protein